MTDLLDTKNQRNPTIGFLEKLVTDERPGTNDSESIGPTSKVGGSKYIPISTDVAVTTHLTCAHEDNIYFCPPPPPRGQKS